MTIKELLEILQNPLFDENSQLKVVIHQNSSIGSTPSVNIIDAQVGFDWDKGKILLIPEEKLVKGEMEYEAKLKKLQEQVGLSQYENRHLKNEIKDLKNKIIFLTEERSNNY